MELRDLRRGIRFSSMAVGMLFVAFALRAALMPAQNDTFWHLRAGADIWRTGAIPRVDHYSHTFAGAPWPDHEWLAQAGMFLAYRLGGMAGLAIGATALVMAASALMWRLTVGPRATRAIVTAIGLALSSWFWVLRPQVLTLFLLAVLLTALVRERYRLLPLLFLAWANAHGGVVLGGLVLAAAWAASVLRVWRAGGAATEADRRRVRTLSIVVPLAGLACAASPLGFGIYRFVIESTARSIAVRITEWFPVLPNEPFGVLFWLATLGLVAAIVARRRLFVDGRASWAQWVTVVATCALMPLAIRSQRNTSPFTLFAIAAASQALGPDFRFSSLWARFKRALPPPPDADSDRPRLNLAMLIGMGAAAIFLAGSAYASGLDRMNWRPIDERALAAARACDGPLYNHYDDGGTLIWFLPEKPVFIDARQDPYPLDFLIEFVAVEAGQRPYRPLLDRFHVRCALLPVKSPTVAGLDRDGWTSRYRDDKWAVLEAPK